MTNVNQWPDGTPKSMNNVFTEKRRSPFDGDQTERAKATLQRKQSIYGQATGAVGHGAAVIEGLSDMAKKRLKAVPFSQPITPRSKKARP